MTACAGTPPPAKILAALDCRPFLNPLRAKTPSAPVPTVPELTGPQGLGRALTFADAQTGQLDKANDRADTVIAIEDLCHAQEERVREALEPPSLWARVKGLWAH
jgi:hypothetical protein